LQSLIVEGGSQILNAFIQAGFWDEMQVETNTTLTVPEGIPAPLISGCCVRKKMIGERVLEKFVRN
jgi:diaminohydroxyphosphoribosylaminopyrimidine deaminase/5-amino-6-(5-phosphoribosylamino)uracil reductase